MLLLHSHLHLIWSLLNSTFLSYRDYRSVTNSLTWCNTKQTAKVQRVESEWYWMTGKWGHYYWSSAQHWAPLRTAAIWPTFGHTSEYNKWSSSSCCAHNRITVTFSHTEKMLAIIQFGPEIQTLSLSNSGLEFNWPLIVLRSEQTDTLTSSWVKTGEFHGYSHFGAIRRWICETIIDRTSWRIIANCRGTAATAAAQWKDLRSTSNYWQYFSGTLDSSCEIALNRLRKCTKRTQYTANKTCTCWHAKQQMVWHTWIESENWPILLIFFLSSCWSANSLLNSLKSLLGGILLRSLPRIAISSEDDGRYLSNESESLKNLVFSPNERALEKMSFSSKLLQNRNASSPRDRQTDTS